VLADARNAPRPSTFCVGAGLLFKTARKALKAIGKGAKLIGTALIVSELARDPSEVFGDAPKILRPELRGLVVHRSIILHAPHFH
jgi:hypothetical protein